MLPASLIHNIITFTWPCHASYWRWMSPAQGQLGNDPHPGLQDGAQSPVILNLDAASQNRQTMQRERGSGGVPPEEGMRSYTTSSSLDLELKESSICDSECFCTCTPYLHAGPNHLPFHPPSAVFLTFSISFHATSAKGYTVNTCC